LGRRIRMTRSRAGTQSSISLTVSPGTAATRTGLHLEVEAHILALKMLGQARPLLSQSETWTPRYRSRSHHCAEVASRALPMARYVKVKA
jgi:hypothetical protein